MKEINVVDLIVLMDRGVASTAIPRPERWGCRYSHKQVMESVNRVMDALCSLKIEVKNEGNKTKS